MFKLTRYIELVSESKVNGTLEYFAIVSGKKAKVFLINELIFNFLKHFETPNSLENVINSYKTKVTLNNEADNTLLKEKLTSFLNNLLDKKWLVAEDKEEIDIVYETLLKTNDSFLHYNIIKILGNKRLTDVYLVKDLKTQNNVVIKLLNYNKFNDFDSFNKYLRYFKAEYEFLKLFNSNYINAANGFSTYNKHSYMLLKEIKGESINKFVFKNKLLSAQKIKLVLKLLKGFSIIHKANVYHGDIHFSNIMVSKTRQPTIIDFGYANKEVKEHITKEKRNGGVYDFIPPERAIRSLERRFSAVTQFQSEVYQIGLIIYFIFCKNLPFTAITWKTMVDEKQTLTINKYKPFLEQRMPKRVRVFIVKCLETNPENRFENAVEMHKEWRKINQNY